MLMIFSIEIFSEIENQIIPNNLRFKESQEGIKALFIDRHN